jgi:hypothetical protein
MDQSPAPCIIFLPLASEREPRGKPAMASIILANSHLLPVSQAVLFSKRFFLLQPETSNPYKENRAIFFSRPNFKPLKAILNSPSQTKAADNAKDNEDASTLRQFTKVTCCAGKSQVTLDGFLFFFEVEHLLLCKKLKVDARYNVA